MNRPPRESLPRCGKCRAVSGDDWSQCGGSCPVVGSPAFNRKTHRKYGDPLGRKA